MPCRPYLPTARTAAARRRRLGLLLGAAVLCGLATACGPAARALPSGGDPLASLAAPVASPAFDLLFWIDQQAGRTTLWRQAFAYCLLHPRLPNCRTVRIATWWAAPPSRPDASAPAPPPVRLPRGSRP
jgi:hypothetical protein